MSDKPKKTTPFTDLKSDQYFLLILLGGIIWFLGLYAGLVGPIITTPGFVLVCFASAVTAMKRPTTNAWPGLILGSVLYIVGQYLSVIPLLNLLSPPFLVTGPILIIFFAVPLALQRGGVPGAEEIQAKLKAKSAKEKAKKKEEEPEEES